MKIKLGKEKWQGGRSAYSVWRVSLQLLLIVMLTASSATYSQTVKKVKIEELEAYIKNADHPLVVSFWATWCSPCIHEIPWLQEAINRHSEKKPELVLVSLDFPEAFPKKIQDFARQKNFAATLFWLDETNADYFCPRIDIKWSGGIPANLFVNNKTGYRKFIQRQVTDRQAMQEVEKMVAEAENK
jgi:thiol-disulfide isomerase/thioredoxin